MSLVSTEWLQKNLNNVKIIDSSWHLPNTKRNGYKEYLKNHIKNSLFFDIDKCSKKNTDLPHMLVDISEWEKIVSDMGIENSDEIVIYDNSDLVSSCRCWYNFLYFGHNPKLVKILNGGFKKWMNEGREVTTNIERVNKTNYQAKERKMLVKNKKQIDENILTAEFKLIDARSLNRFKGIEKEPREGLRSGSIPNSFCLPFGNCINKETNEFLDILKLEEKFKEILKDIKDTNIVFTCGSGVTASVLAFALSLINNKYSPIIYDGSWSEYGKYPS